MFIRANFLYFSLIILCVRVFAFFFLLSRKKEEKCSQKEERKTVVDFKRLAEKRSHNAARVFIGQGNVQCIHFYKNAAPTLAFSGYRLQGDACAFISTKILAHRSYFRDG